MIRWTKKAAIARMSANQELQAVCQEYPLAKVLVESAVKLKQYEGYNESSCHYAYKEWLWGAIPQGESTEYYVVLHVIDDLLPPNGPGSSIYTNNPTLPSLLPLPEHEPDTEPYKIIGWDEIMDEDSELNQRDRRRLALLQEMLQRVSTGDIVEGINNTITVDPAMRTKARRLIRQWTKERANKPRDWWLGIAPSYLCAEFDIPYDEACAILLDLQAKGFIYANKHDTQRRLEDGRICATRFYMRKREREKS
jgi:hypothetical protein